jgi:hypothetical protein
MEEETPVSFSARPSRNLHLGLPRWLAIFLSLFVAIAAVRERARSHPTEVELALPVARRSEMVVVPVEMTQPLVIEPPVFNAAADDWRARVERLTIALIGLTAVMVVVSALLLTHG